MHSLSFSLTHTRMEIRQVLTVKNHGANRCEVRIREGNKGGEYGYIIFHTSTILLKVKKKCPK